MNVLASNQLKTQIKKILYITVGWVLISVFQFNIGYSVVLQLDCNIYPGEPWLYLLSSIITGLVAGVLGGSILVFVWEKWLRSMKYVTALFHIWWTFTVVFFIVSFTTTFFVLVNTSEVPFYHPQVLEKIKSEFLDFNQIQPYFIWMFIVAFTLVGFQINDKYGPGVFRAFLLGKYYHPKREERIFMFLDLRSSTTIAEKLGEEKYFNFLKEIYEIITPSIIYSKGEIYQYVGDEIVISWKTQQGIKDSNCINCFFEVQKTLQQHIPHFEQKYGAKPEFKAGLHCGNVMTGEIGVIKKDIAFSGDVLNTTSRIQSKCNDLGVNILFSDHLRKLLSFKNELNVPKEMGQIKLRGKGIEMVLFTV